MVKIVFARHGQSQANLAGVLAGRRGDNPLTEAGRRQAQAAASLLPSSVALWFTSDIARCVETAELLTAAHRGIHGGQQAQAKTMADFGEVDYGDWSGHKLADLRRRPEWQRVQKRPQDMVFPGGEAQIDALQRTKKAVEEVLSSLRSLDTTAATAVVVSHGDIIKMAVADALGMPLERFQRIAVAPGSLTTIEYSSSAPVLTALSVSASGQTGQAGALGGGK